MVLPEPLYDVIGCVTLVIQGCSSKHCIEDSPKRSSELIFSRFAFAADFTAVKRNINSVNSSCP